MTRDIDDVIEFVRERWASHVSDTQRQVIVNRLETPPTREELDEAAAQLYGQPHRP